MQQQRANLYFVKIHDSNKNTRSPNFICRHFLSVRSYLKLSHPSGPAMALKGSVWTRALDWGCCCSLAVFADPVTPGWVRDCPPADTRRWINAGLTLVQRLQRCTNVKLTLIQRIVSAGPNFPRNILCFRLDHNYAGPAYYALGRHWINFGSNSMGFKSMYHRPTYGPSDILLSHLYHWF